MIGVLLWLANTYIPMDPKIQQIMNVVEIMNVVVVIIVILWLLHVFVGGFGFLHQPVPQIR